MKLKLYLIVLVLTAFLFGLICGMQAKRYPDPFKTDRVSTIRELQRAVGAEEDGVVGPDTIKKWKEKVNNQYAIESIERMAGEKE